MEFIRPLLERLKSARRTFLPTCREAARRQSDFLDQPASFSERFGLRLHLLVCGWCRLYGRQIRFLRKAANEHPAKLEEAPPQVLSASARERLKRALRDQAE